MRRQPEIPLASSRIPSILSSGSLSFVVNTVKVSGSVHEVEAVRRSNPGVAAGLQHAVYRSGSRCSGFWGWRYRVGSGPGQTGSLPPESPARNSGGLRLGFNAVDQASASSGSY